MIKSSNKGSINRRGSSVATLLTPVEISPKAPIVENLYKGIRVQS